MSRIDPNGYMLGIRLPNKSAHLQTVLMGHGLFGSDPKIKLKICKFLVKVTNLVIGIFFEHTPFNSEF